MSLDASSQATSPLVSETPISYLRNVVIFGESGVGKSSIVNMLAGKDLFKVDGGANGTTFEHKGCAIRIGDQTMNIWDTAGLNESKYGLVTPEKAFQQLFDLLHDLGGVDLLVFVMRFRITENTVQNYHLMRGVLCGERVPMVVAITNREFAPDNEEWWQENEINFSRNKMAFKAHAIGTANRHLHFDRTYAELRKGLQDMIQKYAFETKRRFKPTAAELEGGRAYGSQMKPSSTSLDASGEPVHRWFEHAVINVFGRFLKVFRKPKEELLMSYGDVLRKNGMSEEEAARSTQRVREKVRT